LSRSGWAARAGRWSRCGSSLKPAPARTGPTNPPSPPGEVGSGRFLRRPGRIRDALYLRWGWVARISLGVVVVFGMPRRIDEGQRSSVARDDGAVLVCSQPSIRGFVCRCSRAVVHDVGPPNGIPHCSRSSGTHSDRYSTSQDNIDGTLGITHFFGFIRLTQVACVADQSPKRQRGVRIAITAGHRSLALPALISLARNGLTGNGSSST